jgi:hypothetical protein
MQRIVAALAAATILSGCGPYLFRQSNRLVVTSPAVYGTTHNPVTVTWTAQDFTAPADGQFAVFVDRDPLSPGDNIDEYTAQQRSGIYVVDTTSIKLGVLGHLTGVDPAEADHHDVTVVLLDSRGNRIGEYAGFTEFTITGSDP